MEATGRGFATDEEEEEEEEVEGAGWLAGTGLVRTLKREEVEW